MKSKNKGIASPLIIALIAAVVLGGGYLLLSKQKVAEQNPAASGTAQLATTAYQCSDGIDNDADGLIDAADPSCHGDNNASNPASYIPTLNCEICGVIINPLQVTTNPATSITAISAVLNANLSGPLPAGCTSTSGYSSTTGMACNSIPTNDPVTTHFEYHTNQVGSPTTSTSNVIPSILGAFNTSVTGLLANTGYLYRACASNSVGGMVCGSWLSFTTLVPASLPDLRITNVVFNPSDLCVSTTNANIHFTITVLNDSNTTVHMPITTYYTDYQPTGSTNWIRLGTTGLQAYNISAHSTVQVSGVTVASSSLPNLRAHAGTYTLRMTADGLNVVQESNETNNTYMTSVTTAVCGCSGTTPTITVTSPNGGQIYQAGQQITVTWTSCNLPSTDTMKVLVGYFGPGSLNPTTAQAAFITTNTGSATFALPLIPNTYASSLQPGNYYKIVVNDTNTMPTVSDWSDNLFTININPPAGCTSYSGFSSTTGLPCWIITTPATSITSTSVVLNGTLLNGAPLYMGWGLSPYNFGITPILKSVNGPGSSSVITGLTPNTTYQFNACTEQIIGSQLYCAGFLTFTTLP